MADRLPTWEPRDHQAAMLEFHGGSETIKLTPMNKPKNVMGQEYGWLTPLRRAPNQGAHAAWACRCRCGQETTAAGAHLRSGHKKSCGCLKRSNLLATSRTHGLSGHPLFGRWVNMMRRCYDPKSNRWSRYGARGIEVCPGWMSVEGFVADMAPAFTPGATLDRIDNNAGYSPANCRWTGTKEQARNTSKNRKVKSPDGREMIFTDAAGELGIPLSTFFRWANRGRLPAGWAVVA